MKLLCSLKDFLAPKKCMNCASLGVFLCENCMEHIQKNLPFCYVCKKSSPNFEIHSNCKKEIYLDTLVVPYHYKETLIKKSITDGKFYKKQEVFEELGRYIAPIVRTTLQKTDLKNSIIIPIPLHLFRSWKRGYNQSEILARTLAKELIIPFDTLIKKQKNTRHQSHLSRQARLLNIKNCFTIKKSNIDKVDNKIIILVDDVVSTGATLNEAAKILKQNGAKEVMWVVIGSD